MKEITDFAGEIAAEALKVNNTPAEQPLKDALAAAVDAGVKIFAAVKAVSAQRKLAK